MDPELNLWIRKKFHTKINDELDLLQLLYKLNKPNGNSERSDNILFLGRIIERNEYQYTLKLGYIERRSTVGSIETYNFNWFSRTMYRLILGPNLKGPGFW